MATEQERKQNIAQAQVDPLTKRSLETLVNKLFTEKSLNSPAFSVNALNSSFTTSHNRTARLLSDLGITKDENGTFHVTKSKEEMMRTLADNLTVTEFNIFRAFTKELPHRRAEYNKRHRAATRNARRSARERMARYRARKKAEQAQKTDAQKEQQKVIGSLGSDSSLTKAVEAPQQTEPKTQPQQPKPQQHHADLVELETYFDPRAARQRGVRPLSLKKLGNMVEFATEGDHIVAGKLLSAAYGLQQHAEGYSDLKASALLAVKAAETPLKNQGISTNTAPTAAASYPLHYPAYGKTAMADKLYYSRILLLSLLATEEAK